MRPPPAQRVAVLVDSENLEIAVTQHYSRGGTRATGHSIFPDWKRIFPEILQGRQLVRNIYYKKKGERISVKFRRFWENEVRGEILQPLKSADPYIIVDAIALSKKVDTVILLGGDKDFLPLIHYLRVSGCRVEVASYRQALAREVRKTADTVYVLGKKHTVTLAGRQT